MVRLIQLFLKTRDLDYVIYRRKRTSIFIDAFQLAFLAYACFYVMIDAVSVD